MRSKLGSVRWLLVALPVTVVWSSFVPTSLDRPAFTRAYAAAPRTTADSAFARLVQRLSEPGGYFDSDNLISNETSYLHVLDGMRRMKVQGGAYIGVGPDQNFSYIAAVRPNLAFMLDIRRDNLLEHLMYKALFELSADRTEFVSRLFSKPHSDGLGPASSAQDIFNAYWNPQTSDEAVFKKNLKAIGDLLTQKHGFPLSSDDLAGLEYVYHNFYYFGPGINYTSSSLRFGVAGPQYPTYADLMMHTDGSGVSRSYLASEENFKTVKDLQEKNLIVPLVGDFAGPKAIRAVGKYLKEHGATVTAFYVSNVEHFLDGVRNNFCANVASLPLDENSTFIRASRGGDGSSPLGAMQAETKGCWLPSPR